MASRFWVGGTATWDAVTTTNWAASTGGAGGQTVPGSGDTVTFDALSGGGTVTVNNASLSVTSIALGAFTGTLDFSANNNNVALSSSGTGLNASGVGTRALNMGSGTWTYTGIGTFFDFTTLTNAGTLTVGNAALVMSGNTNAIRILIGNSTLTFGNLTIGTNTSKGFVTLQGTGTTYGSITIGDGNTVIGPNGGTITVTGAITGNGTPSSPVGLSCERAGTNTTTFSVGSASVLNYAGVLGITKAGAGSITANNAYDLGRNTGVTFVLPGLRPSFALGM